MSITAEKFILERDYVASVIKPINCISGDHFTNNGNIHMSNITINLVVPGKSVDNDPVTGDQVSKDLKKYRNEYLRESSDVAVDDAFLLIWRKTASTNIYT